MKTLNLDWGLNGSGSIFYLEDDENCVVKTSRIRSNYIDVIVNNTLKIVRRHPEIEVIKLDSFSMGEAIADLLEEELCLIKSDIKVKRYKVMQM